MIRSYLFCMYWYLHIYIYCISFYVFSNCFTVI